VHPEARVAAERNARVNESNERDHKTRKPGYLTFDEVVGPRLKNPKFKKFFEARLRKATRRVK
jgi:hypothetical protein